MRSIVILLGGAALIAAPSCATAQSVTYRLTGAGYNSEGAVGDPGLRAHEQMITTFDGNDSVHFDPSHSSGFAFYTGSHPGTALAPVGDSSQYVALGAGGRMAFDLRQFNTPTTQLSSISVDVGSLDSYNFIQIIGLTSTGALDYNNPLLMLNGTQMATEGRDGRLTFGFDDNAQVGAILFGSTGIAFEFDSLAITTTQRRGTALVAQPVPEPASWALMLGGFGMVGGAMRSRRKSAVTFA